MRRSRTGYRHCRRLATVLFPCYAVGCLPDDALKQTLGENLLLSAAIAIQTITGQFFNTLFGVV
jgi:hypothetical protein